MRDETSSIPESGRRRACRLDRRRRAGDRAVDAGDQMAHADAAGRSRSTRSMAAAEVMSQSASPRRPTTNSRSRSSPPAKSCPACRSSMRCRTAPSRSATPPRTTTSARTRPSPSAPRCRSARTRASTRPGGRIGGGEDVLNEFYKKYNAIGSAGRQHRLPDGRLVPQGDQDGRRSQGPEDAHRRLGRQGPAEARRRAAADRRRRHLSGAGEGHARRLPNGSVRTTTRSSASTRSRRTTTAPGWWEGGSMLLAFVNLDKWNALPKHYQAVLEQAGHYANTWMHGEIRSRSIRRRCGGCSPAAPSCTSFSPPIMEASLQGDAWSCTPRSRKENASFKKVNDSHDGLHQERAISGSRSRNITLRSAS